MDSPCPNSPIPSLSLSLYPSSRPLSLSSSPIPSNGILDCAPYQRGTPAQSEGLHYPGRELSDEITYFFFQRPCVNPRGLLPTIFSFHFFPLKLTLPE